MRQDQPAPFTHYFLGQSFEGLPLARPNYYCAPPYPGSPGSPGRDHEMTFSYGDCNLPGHSPGHCVFPVNVQSSPACDDNYSLYRFGPPDSRRRSLPPLTTLRGAPTLVFGGSDPQINIYTGETTVTIYGENLDQLKRVVGALRQGPQSAGGAAEGAPLPQPISGAMDGTLPCGLRFSHVGVGDPRPCRADNSTCRQASVEVRLPRAAYVTGWTERLRAHGTTDLKFKAKRGTTSRRLRLRVGRYRITLVAEDRQGRHTGTHVIDFRVRGS